MFPRKTDQARTALQSHAGTLNLRERRILILCDGKRSLDELTTLCGADTPALAVRLCEQGFLRIGADSPPVTPAAVVEAPPLPRAAAAPLPASTVASRRSLVAAKMYMIGMLDLQRSEEALARRMHLQACREADATVAHLLAALGYLQQHTNPSMAQRVRERLGEVLPEEYLPALERNAA